MSAVDEVRRLIAANGGASAVQEIVTEPELVKMLRKELGLAADAELSVDGVRVTETTPRQRLLLKAAQYGAVRWGVNMTELDVTTLFKAVADGDMPSLTPLIIDQHMDDIGWADPSEEWTFDEAREAARILKELGFENPSF